MCLRKNLSEKDSDSKHIIFYFDEAELDNIRQLKALIEDYRLYCH
jgi:hypothetical protein